MIQETVVAAVARPSSAALQAKLGDVGTPIELRPPRAADAQACGRIIFEAFAGIADAHGFGRDFPSVAMATGLAQTFIDDPSIFGVVAEIDGKIVGSNFLSEGDSIRAVGPISVDPNVQGRGVGRRLMQAVLERARGARGVRLAQDGFNTRSVALYASLGFAVKEPLLLMRGTPRNRPALDCVVRRMTAEDVGACSKLTHSVHGIERAHELQNAERLFNPVVVERDGRITGYMTAPSFWLMNHGVAETEADMRALMSGAAAIGSEPVSFLLPSRQASLLQWCLAENMTVLKPMTLMAMGHYQEPRGSYFPSVLY